MKDQKTYTTDEMIDFIKNLNTDNAPITDKIIDTLENYNKCIAQLQEENKFKMDVSVSV